MEVAYNNEILIITLISFILLLRADEMTVNNVFTDFKQTNLCLRYVILGQSYEYSYSEGLSWANF
jgi:hypothetical protein